MTFHALADAIYPAGQHTRKPSSYLALYDDLFAPMRDRPLSMLELGVHSGHSLHLWHRFFPRARITGLDMRPCPADIPPDRVAYVRGRQEARIWRFMPLQHVAEIDQNPFFID